MNLRSSLPPGDAATLRARSSAIRIVVDHLGSADSWCPDATDLMWWGPAALTFQGARARLTAALRGMGDDLSVVVAALDRVAAALDEAHAVINRLADRMDTAEIEERVATHLATGDPTSLLLARNAAVAREEMAAIRGQAFVAAELALSELASNDRAAQYAINSVLTRASPQAMHPFTPVAEITAMKNDRFVDWLGSLDTRQLRHFLMSRPQMVGAHPTAPLTERYEANRILMQNFADGELADLIAKVALAEKIAAVTGGGPTGLPALADLTAYRAEIFQRISDRRNLLLFDPTGDGRVIEVWGDLESASHVAVVVPGITNTQFGYEHGLGADAQRLWANDGDVAVIAWLGYDTPGGGLLGGSPLTLGALGIGTATEGAVELRRFVAWLEATRPEAHITVIAHSYGSVVAGLAAADGLAADDLVLVGSPGVDPSQAADMKLRGNGPVWASLAAGDPIDELAAFVEIDSHPDDAQGDSYGLIHGVNPVHDDFGAVEFEITGEKGHSAYFATGGVAALTAIIKKPVDSRPKPSERP